MTRRLSQLSLAAKVVDGGRSASRSSFAELIAGGSLPFPTDLSDNDAAALATLVRQIRRERLIRYIARAIAADLLGPQRPNQEPEC